MSETMVCVVGNVATQPVCKELATGSSARFRLAVTSRYWDREKNEWTDGHTNFFTVWARRTLAANVASSVALGDPVVALNVAARVLDLPASSGSVAEALAHWTARWGARWATRRSA